MAKRKSREPSPTLDQWKRNIRKTQRMAEAKQKSVKTKQRPSSKLLSDVYSSESSKTNISGSHMEAPLTKKKNKRAQDTSDFILAEPGLVTAVHHQKQTKRGDKSYSSIPNQLQKLDSNVFECYLEYLWRNLSKEKSSSFAYLDCLWFALYRKKETKGKVLTWIKSKDIFSRKYVFVPIVCWNHWSLLILCHFGEKFDSKTRTPCMLLMDSLEMTNPKRLEPDIRKFVMDIYKEEGIPEKKTSILRIPLLVPKVPQQKNEADCGIFVLYYINLFLESAPENINHFEDVSSFIAENWVGAEGLETFCKEVRNFCRNTKEQTEQWGNRCLDDLNSPTNPIVL